MNKFKFFASLVLVFLTSLANAALPLFQGQIVKDQAGFVHTLEEEGVLKEGRVFIHVVGMKVYPWLKEKGLLNEEVTENELINQLVGDYGKIMPLENFLAVAKEGKFALADKLLKTSAATASQATPPAEPVAATLAITEAKVAEVAKAAAKDGLSGFDKALRVNNAKAEKNAEEVEKLQQQLAATKAVQKAAAEAAAAAVKSAAAARDELATKVAALPALAETAAEVATKPVKADVARLGNEVSAFQVDVNGRVSAVEHGWFYQYQLPIAAAVAGLLALFALLGVANWRRVSKVKAAAVSTATAEALQALEPVKAVVSGLTDRISSLEAEAPRRFDFSFSDELLVADVKSVAVGGQVTFTFEVEGDKIEHSVTIMRESEDYVRIDGIVGQTQPVRLDRLPARLKRAYVKGDLLTQRVGAKTASNDAVSTLVA